jgi:hypothetical protein
MDGIDDGRSLCKLGAIVASGPPSVSLGEAGLMDRILGVDWGLDCFGKKEYDTSISRHWQIQLISAIGRRFWDLIPLRSSDRRRTLVLDCIGSTWE